MNVIHQRRDDKFLRNFNRIRDEMMEIRKGIKDNVNPEMRAYVHLVYAIVSVAMRDSFSVPPTRGHNWRKAKVRKKQIEKQDNTTNSVSVDAIRWIKKDHEFSVYWTFLSSYYGTNVDVDKVRSWFMSAWRCSTYDPKAKSNAFYARRFTPGHMVSAESHRIS